MLTRRNINVSCNFVTHTRTFFKIVITRIGETTLKEHPVTPVTVKISSLAIVEFNSLCTCSCSPGQGYDDQNVHVCVVVVVAVAVGGISKREQRS